MALNDQLKEYLDRVAAEQLDMLATLVQIPSDNPPGDCANHAEAAAKLLEGMRFTVERHAVPKEIVAEHEMRSVTNLIVREVFGPGPTVALNAHGDVVPPGDGWKTDPYGGEITDGWLYGRGSAVSKSDFATYAYALAALKNCAPDLKGTVELHLTYDEETGGLVGPKWLLDKGLTKPDYVICPAFSYSVTTAHNGCLHIEVSVRGKSAHAAMPESGLDALRGANQLLTQLYKYSDSLGSKVSKIPGIKHPTLVVGLIEGGINTNVVPDRITLRIDRRITPDEDALAVEKELFSLIQEAVDIDGISVTPKRILLALPLQPTNKSEALADLVSKHASAVFEESITTGGVPLYTDARLYAEQGIPTVMYGAGPKNLLDANGHRADERVPIDTLPKVSRVIALTIASLLG